MKAIVITQLAVGMTAVMKVGSPVRQWMRIFHGGPKKWLTPVRYTPVSQGASEPAGGPQFVAVKVAKLMPPYAVVYHHTSRGLVKLWLDTREVALFHGGR